MLITCDCSGSGKTTLVQNILKNTVGLRILVIENEKSRRQLFYFTGAHAEVENVKTKRILTQMLSMACHACNFYLVRP